MKLKKSTKNIIKMHGWRLDRAIHNFVYFAYYDIYIRYFLAAGRLVVKYLRKVPYIVKPWEMIFNRYHGKVITQEDAKKILTLKEDVVLGPDRTERIIPFKYANQIILKEPEYIAVMDCACRMSRENPCQPVNTCIAVGRMTAEFWLEHGEKFHARKITQEEALKIMSDAHEKGMITTAWFKVATGGRTGVICQCCSCCCGAIEADRMVKQLEGSEDVGIIIPSGYTVEIDYDKCTACGTCVEVCNIYHAMSLKEGEKPVYNVDLCKGCGVCVEKCEQQARKLVMDGSKGYPLDIDFAKELLG